MFIFYKVKISFCSIVLILYSYKTSAVICSANCLIRVNQLQVTGMTMCTLPDTKYCLPFSHAQNGFRCATIMIRLT